MVMAHAAVADTAKWQVMLADMEQAVVDADAAGHDVLNQTVDQGLVVAERIKCQWPRPGIDGIDCFVNGCVSHDGQYRPENFPAAQGAIWRCVEYDVRCDFVCGVIPFFAGNEL